MFSQFPSHLLCISSPINIQTEVTHPVVLCFNVLHFSGFLVTCNQKVSQPQHCNVMGISHRYYFKLLKSTQNIGSLELRSRKFDFGAKRLIPYLSPGSLITQSMPGQPKKTLPAPMVLNRIALRMLSAFFQTTRQPQI